jgi:hypothetical protein
MTAKLLAGTMLAGILTLAGGCDRSYLTASHGRAFRESFAAQTVNPDRRSDAKSVTGLDSQEASIIAGTYRKSLGPAAAGNAEGQTRLLTYSREGGLREASMPPPSVGTP